MTTRKITAELNCECNGLGEVLKGKDVTICQCVLDQLDEGCGTDIEIIIHPGAFADLNDSDYF